MMRTRMCSIGVTVAVMTALISAQAPQAPTFQVDPFWPRPLSNHWLLGSVTGVAVDSQNHVWVIHRGAVSLHPRTEMSAATNPPTAQECCVPAPQVLRFDPAGRVVAHWGGPGTGYDWPQSPGAIAVDGKGNVWIAASGPGEPQLGGRGRGAAPATPAPATPPPDGHILKFSTDGRFLLQIGKPGQPLTGTTALRRPTAMDVDLTAGEVYVADGLDGRRIVVLDTETGAFKREWGAYGARPDAGDIGAYDPAAPAAKQFRAPSCVKLSKDGFVYVCDRRNNRIQVFRKDGTFVKEAVVAKSTLGEGSAWSVAFSRDPQERFLYVADGSNQKVWVLERGSLTVLSAVGSGGRSAGQFYGVGTVAVDSSGNLYTGETYEGKRVQKFVAKGLGPASAKEGR